MLARAKFTLPLSLAFSYIGSVTARHSTSERQRNFAAWYVYKEWNYGTLADDATFKYSAWVAKFRHFFISNELQCTLLPIEHFNISVTKWRRESVRVTQNLTPDVINTNYLTTRFIMTYINILSLLV